MPLGSGSLSTCGVPAPAIGGAGALGGTVVGGLVAGTLVGGGVLGTTVVSTTVVANAVVATAVVTGATVVTTAVVDATVGGGSAAVVLGAIVTVGCDVACEVVAGMPICLRLVTRRRSK